MITKLISEVGELWNWTIGVVAGLGVTTCILIAGFVVVYIRLRRIEGIIRMNKNIFIAESRDLSIRIRKMEDQKK